MWGTLNYSLRNKLLLIRLLDTDLRHDGSVLQACEEIYSFVESSRCPMYWYNSGNICSVSRSIKQCQYAE